MATLEGAKHGTTFAAGMGAISSITQILNTGDHIVCCNNVYAGVTYYYDQVAKHLGFQIDLVKATDLTDIRRVIKPNTRVRADEAKSYMSCSFIDKWGYYVIFNYCFVDDLGGIGVKSIT